MSVFLWQCPPKSSIPSHSCPVQDVVSQLLSHCDLRIHMMVCSVWGLLSTTDGLLSWTSERWWLIGLVCNGLGCDVWWDVWPWACLKVALQEQKRVKAQNCFWDSGFGFSLMIKAVSVSSSPSCGLVSSSNSDPRINMSFHSKLLLTILYVVLSLPGSWTWAKLPKLLVYCPVSLYFWLFMDTPATA